MDIGKKSLGQHWLRNQKILAQICEYAELGSEDTVLEIGSGLGDLTDELVQRAGKVIAVEKDEKLADQLTRKVLPEKLEVITGDILKFDLGKLPKGYKVVANIPYYLTSNLLRVLSESANRPRLMVLLVQKEVAERITAGPGQMSVLAVSVQLYNQTSLGIVVPAKAFEPPPKVDSQVVILKRREEPLFKNLDDKEFFRIVKAGFSERRKKLRSSLSGGLGISVEEADELLTSSGVAENRRAQELSLQEWHILSKNYATLEGISS